MRTTSFTLGILGGLAGVGVHAVLLVRFFSQSHGLFQVFLELLLAVLLGLAAILVAVLCRNSPRTLAVFLPLLGILGFFPRLLSWVPAGVLLVAGGVVAIIVAWRGSRNTTPVIPAMVMGPNGTSLHWSEAVRLGIPITPARPAAGTGERRWSTGRKAGIITGAVVAAAIVIPLSLGTLTLNGTADAAVASGGTDTTTQSSAATGTTSVSVPATSPATSTTVAPSSTTTTAPSEDEDFVWYTHEQYGYAIKFPTAWRATNPTEVGERTYRPLAEAYQETVAAVAFADWGSPTFNGCYLDFIWVEVWDESVMDVPTLPEFRNLLNENMDYNQSTFDGVKRVEPLQDITIAGMRGAKHIWSVLFAGSPLVMMEVVLVGDQRAYFLQFAAVEDDWAACEPVFEEILRDFAVSGPEPVS